MKAWILAGWIVTIPALAQTQLDLRTQSRGVDFSGSRGTRPFESGGILPATCTAGEMFFRTNAPAGRNLYGCVAANTWALQGDGGTELPAGSVLTLRSGGTLVGTTAAVDVLAGSGILTSVIQSGGSISVQHSADTALLQTREEAQSGSGVFCESTPGTGNDYACNLNPVLRSYTPGMTIHWKLDRDATGGPTTLNIDTLGPLAVKLSDGSSDPAAGDLAAGRMYPLWYDGVRFRLLSAAPSSMSAAASRPACAEALRGRLWFSVAAAGVQDQLAVCAKDAAEGYAWRSLY